jgi:hypothetical protein
MTIAILIVAAVVGGTIGGILGTKKKSPSGDDGIASPSDPVPSSTAPDPTPNGTTTVVATVVAPSPMRMIVTTQDEVTIFNFWQDATGNLWMHGYYNTPSTWADAFRLNVTYAAVDNTPLAAVTWRFSDYFVSQARSCLHESPQLSTELHDLGTSSALYSTKPS